MDQILSRLCLFLAFCFVIQLGYAQQEEDVNFSHLINMAQKDIFLNPENAIKSYEEGIASFQENGDTLKTISLLTELAYLYAQIADYSNSYDNYWEALILAEQYGSEEAKASVYNGLGWLYSFYQRKELAIKYYRLSLGINNQSKEKSPTKNQNILDDYYALATLYRKFGDLELANHYLDSCSRMLKGPLDLESNRAFVLAEKGYVNYKANKIDQSLIELSEAKSFFESYDSSYLIILYPFLGDIHREKNELKLSEDYYKKSITISETYKSHLDLIPDVYRRLSELYYEQGQYKLAHEYMLESNRLNEIQFGSRSVSNQGLLEIKDDFRMEMEHQQELIREEQLATLAQMNKNRRLQTYILLLSIVFILFSAVLIYRNLSAKHRTEKKLLKQQQELEVQKTLEIIEAKNKELTSSALHVIEKEELLAETKEQLLKQKTNPNPNEISKIIKSIDLSTGKSWKEFELRFLQVNRAFYKTLQEKHSNLSQNDHKICALIKLNFSSKDMSNLLGISVESVHTTRYRLRKKIGLGRQDNLEDYIAHLS